MSDVVVFPGPGGVVVRYPAPGVLAQDVVVAGEHAVISDALLPHGHAAGMLFRDAWRWSGVSASPVSLDPDAARAIQRDRWRAARQPLLDKLDALKQRAEETGDTASVSSIIARKAALRSVTDTDLSTATDADAIAAVWPSCLSDPLP